MKGGSLKTNELKQFLEASYLDPAPNEINGYTLDTQLSNSNLKKVVVSSRGTGKENLGADWIPNAVFAVNSNAYKLTPRYKTAVKMYTDAMKKTKVINLNY